MAMTLPLRARCNIALEEVLRHCDGVSAIMLALRDGRPYTEISRNHVDGGKFAAMASSLSALGHSVLRELGGGSLDHVLVEGAEGKLVVSNVPGSKGLFILAVLANHEARLGLVLGHARACSRVISGAIASSQGG
jgi:predicted regulator of Ras-like GTPase activity (Roadblock/LC7/MglB family)